MVSLFLRIPVIKAQNISGLDLIWIHGDMFDYIIVDEDALEGAIKDGWCKTTYEAKTGVKPVAKRARKPKTEE